MVKLALIRLEDRIVYDAAPLPCPEPAEPAPTADCVDAGQDAAETNGQPEQSENVERGDDAAASAPDQGAVVPDADADPVSLNSYLAVYHADDAFEAADAGLVQPMDSPEAAAFYSRVAAEMGSIDEKEKAAESAAPGAEEETMEAAPSPEARSAANNPDLLDIWGDSSIFDQFLVDGNFSKEFLCFIINLQKSRYNGSEYVSEGKSPLQDYLIGGRLGAEADAYGSDLNLYWLLDSGEKAYLLDGKIDFGHNMQLIIFRNNDGEAIFRANVGSRSGETVDIPYKDVLDQFRFYSTPDDIESTDTRYSLQVTSHTSGGSQTESKQLNPAPPVPLPGDDDTNIEPTGPSGAPDDDAAPGQSFETATSLDDGSDPGEAYVEPVADEFDLARNADIEDLIRLEELPEDVRAEIGEISELVGEIGESDIPDAQDVAAGIVEFAETYTMFNKGVSRLIGMLAGVEGLDRNPALADWVGDVVKRGERLIGESSRHVSSLLQAIREFRATEASMRDSMSYTQISGINAAMDDVNLRIRVIVAGLDMLSDNIAAMRGGGAAADVMALLPAVEEHMAAVAKDMRRLDGMRDSMFYVLRSTKALNAAPGG